VITRRTKIQLLVFVIITIVGVSYVGARYARLDRLFYDSSYTVVAHFPESGGIFAGGEVTYRGVGIGKVEKLELTDSGVDVYLDIENRYDSIPADTLALVGNRSAVGEQYVELQPRTDSKPYLSDDSQIDVADTETPIRTEKLLEDLSDTVSSVDRPALKTTITELGAAFSGTGEDLQRILDTGNSFIQAADDNFEVTTDLIRDANTVLGTQIDSESSIRTFADQLGLFSDTLADADPDLRRLIDNASPAATQLRRLIEDNQVELGDLINNLITTGEVVTRHLDGIEQLLVIYPYVVEGGVTVVSKSPDTGLYDAHFGLVLTPAQLCERGYQGTDTRPPDDRGNRPLNVDARCDEPPTVTNPRGAQNAPRPAADYSAPAATYDPETGELVWGAERAQRLESRGTVAPPTLGEESWKWLFLQPLMSQD